MKKSPRANVLPKHQPRRGQEFELCNCETLTARPKARFSAKVGGFYELDLFDIANLVGFNAVDRIDDYFIFEGIDTIDRIHRVETIHKSHVFHANYCNARSTEAITIFVTFNIQAYQASLSQ